MFKHFLNLLLKLLDYRLGFLVFLSFLSALDAIVERLSHLIIPEFSL